MPETALEMAAQRQVTKAAGAGCKGRALICFYRNKKLGTSGPPFCHRWSLPLPYTADDEAARQQPKNEGGNEGTCIAHTPASTVGLDTPQLKGVEPNTRLSWGHGQLRQKHLAPSNSTARDRWFTKPSSISFPNSHSF